MGNNVVQLKKATFTNLSNCFDEIDELAQQMYEPAPSHTKQPVKKEKITLKPLDFLKCCTTEPEPLDFVLPGLVRGSVGSIIAPGSTGKSMLALQLAINIAGGDSTIPLKIKNGKVLYLAAEDPGQVLHKRIHEMQQWLGDSEIIAHNLKLVPCNAMDICSESVQEAIIDAGKGCRLIILDTLRRFHIEDENDGGGMVKVINEMEKVARATGAAVVFIHHTSKSAALNGQGGTQQASRGSSVLVDNIRWQGYLAGMTKDEAEKKEIDDEMRSTYVQFGLSKVNYSAPINPVWLMRSPYGGMLIPAIFAADPFARSPFNPDREMPILSGGESFEIEDKQVKQDARDSIDMKTSDTKLAHYQAVKDGDYECDF